MTPIRLTASLRETTTFNAGCILLLCAQCCIYLPAQTKSIYDINHLKSFQNQLRHDNITTWISPDTATGLLLEKANPVVKASHDKNHRMGTVIVSFELTKSGEVQHATVMSGPKELQKPVLKAVEQYKYNPYLINGTPSAVATSVSVTVYDY
ncbi:MAG: energy transducer TonB [Terracidiphilus sp.]